MAEVGMLAAVGIWSALRFMRCGRCSMPVGLLQGLYRVFTFSDGCWGCQRAELRGEEPRVSTPSPTDPELTRRHAEIVEQVATMVSRQRQEMREALQIERLAVE